MALTHTNEELINKAAGILGKYVPGEALGAIEHETIDRSYASVRSEIEKIFAITDPNEIPDLVFETVARLTAVYAAADFSNQPLDLNVVMQHEQRLRYLLAQTPTYEVLATNHF